MTIQIGDTCTTPAGNSATVQRLGTDDDEIFAFCQLYGGRELWIAVDSLERVSMPRSKRKKRSS